MSSLKKIWQKVLNVDEVFEADNFFDLGGDSFSALKIVLEAKEHGIHLSIHDIFEKQTIKSLLKPSQKDPT